MEQEQRRTIVLNSTVINVTQRPISLSGTRLYDATTNAVASDLSTHANLVGSETLTLSGTGTIANKMLVIIKQ